jgi:hypothetical protein
MDGIAAWQTKIDKFLLTEMPACLAAVEYPAPAYGKPKPLADIARAKIAASHAKGASDALYLVSAYGDELTMLLQLNVWRFVVVYSLPETAEMDMAMLEARLERWQIGAQHAGWQIGWKQSAQPEHDQRRIVQIYCYAFADKNLLDNPPEKLFWRTDIVQMTRALMLEARRVGIKLRLDQS